MLWQKPHYDSQLQGGILLNDGYASEMATGEGKTLTATLPTYLNALLGKGAHVLTPNGYLARRDFEEMSELYEMLGLSCGLVEDRKRLLEEDIQKKQRQILEPEIEKYIASATTPEDKEKLEIEFFKERKHQELIRKAREQAREALEIEDRVKRQAAYKADVTYGASSVVAFDYLHDDLAHDTRLMVQRREKPNFVVIDEMDAVLFDDATMPFTISGYADDKERDISERERQEQERKIQIANSLLMRLEEESSKIEKRYGPIFRLVEPFSNSNYTNIIESRIMSPRLFPFGRDEVNKKAEFYLQTKAILVNSNTHEFHITELGETIFFQYFCDSEVRRILKENAEIIANLTYDDKLVYKNGEHYHLDEKGNITMEPVALNHLITSGTIPELTEKCYSFLGNEMVEYMPYVRNAIMAWHVLEEDVDYNLTKPKGESHKKDRVVTLVTNGRTAEGRVFSNGLQQALEARVTTKYKGTYNIKQNDMKVTLASIPTASFFGRYSKISGMSGTSAVEAFRNLYNIETKKVPRNKPKRSIDRGDILYPDEESKLNGLLEEVVSSYIKGQPVLITATTIEESKKIAAFLQEKLIPTLEERYPGKEFNAVDIPVLNANVDLVEEANIVSQAGRKGAITIATEMAGRGTDIKLGGEIPSFEDTLASVIEEKTNQAAKNAESKGITITPEIREKLRKLTMDSPLTMEIARKKHESLAATITKEKDEVREAGGLKVIGVGHFYSERNDDQVKGRCGRQGDPGEVVFINDQEDLLKIGVPLPEVEQLVEQAKRGPIVEDPSIGYRPVGKVIEIAQSKNEGVKESAIKASQEVEAEISIYRRDFTAQKKELRRSGDYIDAVEFMIEETVKVVIIGASSEKRPSFTDDTSVAASKINLEELVSLSQEYLGISASDIKLDRIKNLGELREILTDRSLTIFRDRIEKEGKEAVNADCKDLINKMFGRTWAHFEEFIEVIKQQETLNRMGQYQNGTPVPAQILDAYKHAIETERGDLVRLAVNKEYRENLKKAEIEAEQAIKVAERLEKEAKAAEREAKRAKIELERAREKKQNHLDRKEKQAEEKERIAIEKRKQADEARQQQETKAAALVKARSRREIYPVRVTPVGIERVGKDHDEKEAAISEKAREGAREFIQSHIKNLRPRPMLFTILGVKLNKNSKDVGQPDYEILNNAIEAVDFSDHSSSRGKK